MNTPSMERPRRAPNPPSVTNPGRLQRAAILRTHHAGVMCSAELALGKKRAEFLGYQGSHCAAVDLEEKPPWILVDSWWIPSQRITRA